jgi:hypothetical protein
MCKFKRRINDSKFFMIIIRMQQVKKIFLACSRQKQRKPITNNKMTWNKSNFKYVFSSIMSFHTSVKGSHFLVDSLN